MLPLMSMTTARSSGGRGVCTSSAAGVMRTRRSVISEVEDRGQAGVISMLGFMTTVSAGLIS